MSVIEIVGGAILLVASLVIVFLTLMQHTHGQGLSGAINGSVGGANNARLTPADQMLAKVTRIAGVVFFVVAILACLFAGVWQAEKALQPRGTDGAVFLCRKVRAAGSAGCRKEGTGKGARPKAGLCSAGDARPRK